jgi:hypothetical protein
MIGFYLKKLLLNDKIRRKIIRKKIKKNSRPHKLFKHVTWVIRMEISYIEK